MRILTGLLTLVIVGLSIMEPASSQGGGGKIRPANWVECAQHCATFGETQCACTIALGGTCHIKNPEDGSCVGEECHESGEGSAGHTCEDGVAGD